VPGVPKNGLGYPVEDPVLVGGAADVLLMDVQVGAAALEEQARLLLWPQDQVGVAAELALGPLCVPVPLPVSVDPWTRPQHRGDVDVADRVDGWVEVRAEDPDLKDQQRGVWFGVVVTYRARSSSTSRSALAREIGFRNDAMDKAPPRTVVSHSRPPPYGSGTCWDTR